MNHFHGRLPPNIGHTLPNLQFFLGGVNNFSGPIPISLTNLTSLVNVDFKENSLTGQLPVNIGKLRGLIRLNFGSNLLGTGEASDLGFLPSLSNCTSLQVLSIDNNRLGGELPVSIANLSTQLWILTMGGNLLKGSIPVGIGNLVNLTLLAIEENNLTGSVPKDIGNLQMLRQLLLSRNGLSGSIPSSFGNLTQLISLSVAENRLEGSIPSSLGNCRNLISLNLSHNFLKGTIPKEVIGLSSLSISFSASHNSLSGSLPLEIGDLKNLEELQLSENKLSGRIPSTLGNCLSLERLRMAGNFFQGTIPESLSDLRGIQEMDLSRNSLSGKIPEFLTKLSSLYFLNLSFNYLTGEVPKEGIFRNATAVSLRGNSKLCSDDQELELSACHEQGSPTSGKSLSGRDVALIALAIVVFLPLSVFCTLYWLRCRRRNSTTTASPSSEEQLSEISYLELLKATDGFSSDSLRGVGSFGSVYKGTLYKDGSIVAVKVLNLHERGASKSFITECNALRNIRHRNLVKIISACSSVDPQGNDFKALVLEFMPNGSLEEWLHPNIDEKHEVRKLSIGQRLSIAIDVAFAMEYLHHHIQTPIVHCDLKPSNVLLDEDMIAHVGDFGLAKFLYETTESIQAMSAGLKGSIGYIPPGMCKKISFCFYWKAAIEEITYT
ncbi:hypothetical protein Scep_005618 [Stephania cephalantha]|uniref:non-specific serine/threonine protein kinase n=1 Tax=Stephania cephalantha TaxID=152367 RepID=A0AAP0KXS0_9MAGN